MDAGTGGNRTDSAAGLHEHPGAVLLTGETGLFTAELVMRNVAVKLTGERRVEVIGLAPADVARLASELSYTIEELGPRAGDLCGQYG